MSKRKIFPIGQRIRTLREAHELSRPNFALVLETPAATIKNYELSYRYPGAEVIESIARCFGPDWALYVLGAAPQPPANPYIFDV